MDFAPSPAVDAIRARLDHPVIDSDGHAVEYLPVVRDILRAQAGDDAVAALERMTSSGSLIRELTPDQRRAAGLSRMTWWGLPTRNTLDRATAMLPALLAERLGELGLDHAVLYPTYGLIVTPQDDDAVRRPFARAFNTFYAETYCSNTSRDLSDRLTPVGIIPMHTPDEAIAELDFATAELGLKAFMFGGPVQRPYPGQDPSTRVARWVDTLGPDSPYDYDPVWARCVELGVAPTFHSAATGWGSRTSTTSYVWNHIGMFATAGEAMARSLFLSGVPHRFPELRFAFLEGGVAWAANLYSDLLGHWEKRNRAFMDEHLRPMNLDTAEFRRLFEQYTAGDPRYAGKIDDIIARNLDALESDTSQAELTERDLGSDDFAHVHIDGPDDIRRLFTQNFYFGCEADDPMTSIAFDAKMGLELKPLLGSDIAHFDVIDATEVLGEAYELVEDGHITEGDFRKFTFSNVVQLYRGMNPSFFTGTVVEADAEAEFAKYQGAE
jgi:predicted TIM-barrel fold metal-dependent hydrolase